jgi:hypothetical protein
MTFLLSYQNVLQYLIEKRFCDRQEEETAKIEPRIAKNFNLLVNLSDDRKFLVKQEPHDKEGKTAREFFREWRIQEFVEQSSEANHLSCWLPEVQHFDRDNSILVVKYLDDYKNLAEFYGKEHVFPTEIARAIGAMLATFDRTTFDRQNCQTFFSSELGDKSLTNYNQVTNLARSLEKIEPEVFGQYPADGLKFLMLYQRFDSLGKAIAELSKAIKPCCLVHNDLKLNNILLPDDWDRANSIAIKLIDWERSSWGDPAFDLGMLISSYLTMWLGSLSVSNAISIEEGLRLAMTPLEMIQPSNTALIKAYLSNFPEIIEHRPDFLLRVIQFAGLALIQAIQAMLQYEKSFNNAGICMLQVAKTLLCRPEASISTVFGIETSEIKFFSNVSV